MEIRALPIHSITCSSYRTTNFVQPPLYKFPLPPLRMFTQLSSVHTSPKSLLLTFNTRSSHSPSFPKCRHFSRQDHLLPVQSLAHDDASLGLATGAVKPASSSESMKKAVEIERSLKGTSLFLLGMNCSMKTSVAKEIADMLQYQYFDSDQLVEESAGSDPSGKSYKERDDEGFRKYETEALRQLTAMGHLVVNAGNGAVQCATNLQLLRDGISVWIDLPVDMIAKEVLEDKKLTAPLASSSEVLSYTTAVYEENREGYATADAHVSLLKVVSKLGYNEYHQVSAEDMVLEVFSEIEKLTRVKKMMEEAARPF